jgi:hypothetical protein
MGVRIVTDTRAMSGSKASPATAFWAFVGICVIVFAAIKFSVLTPIWGPQTSELPLWLAAALLLAFLAPLRMAEMPKSMAIILRFLFVLFAVYFAFPLTLPSHAGFGILTELRLEYRQFVFPLACVLGLWRPGFGALAIGAAICERRTLGLWFGDKLSATEFFPVAEVAIFLVLSAMLWKIIGKNGYFSRAAQPMDDDDRLSVLTKITLLGICLHLANYFYSGVAKAFLSSSPLDWLLENQTGNMLLVANELNQLPLNIVSGLPEISYIALNKFLFLVNAATFFGQLLAIVVVARIRWIILITLFYDIMHVGILFVSGIFFYKWIVMNFAIIAGLASIRYEKVPSSFKIGMVAFILASPLVFHVANLAWWDSSATNQEHIYAVMDDGSEVEVPRNYWGSFSVNYAQQRRLPNWDNSFFPSRYGNIKDQKLNRLGNDCAIKLPVESAEDALTQETAKDSNNISTHIRRHHRYVLENVNEDGTIEYDFYPHHIWTMPWNFSAFEKIDKRRIRSYKFEVEAVCLGFANGQFTRKLIRKKSYEISLP